MPNHFAHFAINADDVDRGRRFYEQVFGWQFRPWGPSGFYQIDMQAGPAVPVIGALQQRRELLPGVPMHSFEATISVDDIDAIAARIKQAGGRIVMEKSLIPGVGSLLFFEDTEGNIVGAIQFEKKTPDAG